ncbi:toxin CcdB [Geoalkalibacter ferrihydriticus]|uniref:Toxin CcdB n=2 Tax=Geoalkalibacter ferrihydriticus TaxID=392333 RepID=A0A0C2EC78_9BACT|nr:CcdB family protein [Geoalkalibacter ferrihydriticus]KIH76163.1 plasmid maintenance protein CcdB [Geoalkalibacter ferrihydriticus DSM 17813]SDM41742.1 toxin CcdB [Geoalkalibacter ferrihydriticus]
MARFDVYLNKEGQGCLLDVQADILCHLNTRLVVPLLPQAQAPQPAQHLNPCFAIAGESLVMATQFMAAVPAGILDTPLTDLRQHRHEIVAAIDFLLQGF